MIGKAILLGLSTGMYCLGFCMPVLVPLVVGGYRETMARRAIPLLYFSLGRLVAYCLFGALVGYLGMQIQNPLVVRIGAGAMIGLSVLLIVMGLSGNRLPGHSCRTIAGRFGVAGMPVMLGFFTGFNLCPPFILALNAVFLQGDVMEGVGFFLVFFLTTSLYLLPFVFVGSLGKNDNIRWVARLSGVVSGVLFLFSGLATLSAAAAGLH